MICCTHLLETCHREKIAADLRHAHDELVEAFSIIEANRCNLIEVCCSATSGLTERILQKGGRAYRVGLENHMDMSTDVGYLKVDVVFFAMWAKQPSSELESKKIPNKSETSRKRGKAKRIIRRYLKLAREQVNRGGHIGWEWPRTNLGWQDTEVQNFFRSLSQEGLLHVARLDGCQVGVMAHDSGLLPNRLAKTKICLIVRFLKFV